MNTASIFKNILHEQYFSTEKNDPSYFDLTDVFLLKMNLRLLPSDSVKFNGDIGRSHN